MDINADLGEGVRPRGDGELFGLITSANIACGGHAGDPDSMLAACELAVAGAVAVGAHPSYDDREGFGRRETGVPAEGINRLVASQLEGFIAVAGRAGVAVSHVKPHGALYHRLEVDPAAAAGFARAVSSLLPGAALFGTPGSALRGAAADEGLRFVAEGFADRGYAPDGTLLARGVAGATLGPDEAGRQALRLIGQLEPAPGMPASRIETICVHGDGDEAVEVARAVRTALEQAGIDPQRHS